MTLKARASNDTRFVPSNSTFILRTRARGNAVRWLSIQGKTLRLVTQITMSSVRPHEKLAPTAPRAKSSLEAEKPHRLVPRHLTQGVSL